MWGERARVTSASVTPKTATISWEYANSAGRWRYEIIYCAFTSHCLLLRFFFSSNFISLLITRCLLQSKQKLVLLHFIPWDATRWFKTSKHQFIYLYTIIDVMDITASCSIPSWLYRGVLQSLCFAFLELNTFSLQMIWKNWVKILNISINFKNALILVCSFALMTATLNLHELPYVLYWILKLYVLTPLYTFIYYIM